MYDALQKHKDIKHLRHAAEEILRKQKHGCTEWKNAVPLPFLRINTLLFPREVENTILFDSVKCKFRK